MVKVPTLKLVCESKICDLVPCRPTERTLGGQRRFGEGPALLRGL